MTKIVFLPDNVTVEAEPGELLLDVAKRAGLSIPTGCLMGSCHACEVEVDGGDVAVVGDLLVHELAGTVDEHDAGGERALAVLDAREDALPELRLADALRGQVALGDGVARDVDGRRRRHLRLPLARGRLPLPAVRAAHASRCPRERPAGPIRHTATPATGPHPPG